MQIPVVLLIYRYLNCHASSSFIDGAFFIVPFKYSNDLPPSIGLLSICVPFASFALSHTYILISLRLFTILNSLYDSYNPKLSNTLPAILLKLMYQCCLV